MKTENTPCSCLQESEEKILSHLREKHPNYTIEDGASYQNKAYLFALGKSRLYHEFKYTYTFTKVNGETSKPKSETVSITPSFCCFCGKPFES